MTDEGKSEDVFKDGPIKQQKQPEIRDGKRREKALDRLRLQGFWPIYAAFLAAAITPPLAEDTSWKIALRFGGIGIAMLGLLMRIWSFGYLLKKAELATAGPYGRTRNPLYVGTWLIGCGLSLNTGWPYNVIIFGAFNIAFYLIYKAQIMIEEEMLLSIYEEPYEEYCQKVPRFFPQSTAWRKGDVSKFNLARALKNNAWQPIAGVFVFLLLQAISWGIVWPMIRGESFSSALKTFTAGNWIGL
ncbi:MAG: isoprenylcysteine carboxylmethyltransferase family protein [Planctomycetota bacterium]